MVPAIRSNNISPDPTDCLISFGANLGDEVSIFEQATQELGLHAQITVSGTSTPLLTRPTGGPAEQADYLNAVVRIQTTLTAQELHRELIRLETKLGRQRQTRWEARRIDLDLLLHGETRLDSDSLTIPHPRMSFRRFVLEPANEIASGMLHPVAQMTISELIKHLDETPQSVLWYTKRDPTIEKIYRMLSDDENLTAWSIRLTDDSHEFAAFQQQAKLVLWGQAVPGPGLSFRGPQLQLSSILPIELEIRHALEAMQPLS